MNHERRRSESNCDFFCFDFCLNHNDEVYLVKKDKKTNIEKISLRKNNHPDIQQHNPHNNASINNNIGQYPSQKMLKNKKVFYAPRTTDRRYQELETKDKNNSLNNSMFIRHKTEELQEVEKQIEHLTEQFKFKIDKLKQIKQELELLKP